MWFEIDLLHYGNFSRSCYRGCDQNSGADGCGKTWCKSLQYPDEQFKLASPGPSSKEG